jgi:hypothetical protein
MFSSTDDNNVACDALYCGTIMHGEHGIFGPRVVPISLRGRPFFFRTILFLRGARVFIVCWSCIKSSATRDVTRPTVLFYRARAIIAKPCFSRRPLPQSRRSVVRQPPTVHLRPDVRFSFKRNVHDDYNNDVHYRRISTLYALARAGESEDHRRLRSRRPRIVRCYCCVTPLSRARVNQRCAGVRRETTPTVENRLLTRWRAQRRLTFDTRTRTAARPYCRHQRSRRSLASPRRCCCSVAPLQHVHALSQTRKRSPSSFRRSAAAVAAAHKEI